MTFTIPRREDESTSTSTDLFSVGGSVSGWAGDWSAAPQAIKRRLTKGGPPTPTHDTHTTAARSTGARPRHRLGGVFGAVANTVDSVVHSYINENRDLPSQAKAQEPARKSQPVGSPLVPAPTAVAGHLWLGGDEDAAQSPAGGSGFGGETAVGALTFEQQASQEFAQACASVTDMTLSDDSSEDDCGCGHGDCEGDDCSHVPRGVGDRRRSGNSEERLASSLPIYVESTTADEDISAGSVGDDSVPSTSQEDVPRRLAVRSMVRRQGGRRNLFAAHEM
eukprot:GFYU01009918.1.p1 GENE.GFYU01009918.1~~GFYU01009918.1.p1  ORF type:complete len:279 (-),score=41.46 GFYU01009918.1:429-1265(-)